jgi:hypothetical protein
LITGRGVNLATASVATGAEQRGTGECPKDSDDESRKSVILEWTAPTVPLFTAERRDFPATLTTSVVFSTTFKPEALPCCPDKMSFFVAFNSFASAFSMMKVFSPLRETCFLFFEVVFFWGAASVSAADTTSNM